MKQTYREGECDRLCLHEALDGFCVLLVVSVYCWSVVYVDTV